MNLRFSGKQAFILGGTCDLALDLAERLIREDIMPTLTHRNTQGVERIHHRLAAYPARYQTCFLDLEQQDSLPNLCGAGAPDPQYFIDLAHGNLETLVAAGDHREISAYFNAQVSTRTLVIREICRAMLKNHSGRMVFISSTAAVSPNPGQGLYAAAKNAIEALYRNIGLELGSRGITTVILRPGYVDAGRGHHYRQRKSEEILNKIPIRRLLSVDEISATILFLLSDSARGFNATALTLDGGLTAGK